MTPSVIDQMRASCNKVVCAACQVRSQPLSRRQYTRPLPDPGSCLTPRRSARWCLAPARKLVTLWQAGTDGLRSRWGSDRCIFLCFFFSNHPYLSTHSASCSLPYLLSFLGCPWLDQCWICTNFYNLHRLCLAMRLSEWERKTHIRRMLYKTHNPLQVPVSAPQRHFMVAFSQQACDINMKAHHYAWNCKFAL